MTCLLLETTYVLVHGGSHVDSEETTRDGKADKEGRIGLV